MPPLGTLRMLALGDRTEKLRMVVERGTEKLRAVFARFKEPTLDLLRLKLALLGRYVLKVRFKFDWLVTKFRLKFD